MTPTSSLTASGTATPLATLTATATMTLMNTPLTESGPPDVVKVVVVPNPWFDPGTNPVVSYLLKGRAESVEIRVYTKSQTMVLHVTEAGKMAGWQYTPLDCRTLNSGAYYVKVNARGDGGEGKPALGKWMILR